MQSVNSEEPSARPTAEEASCKAGAQFSVLRCSLSEVMSWLEAGPGGDAMTQEAT